MSRIWVVNDVQTCIPGTETLWHDLVSWLDAEWVGDASYPLLAGRVEERAKASALPSVIIRNGTWFCPIDLDVPTISLIQDIMPANSYQRAEQIRVAKLSTLTVFNSAYTKARYPELADITSRVIPLSVDSDIFQPMKVPPIADVCWIGAPTYIKGWDILGEVIKSSARTFAIVLKERSTGRTPDNVRIFDRVPHTELPKIINGCSVGLCTSREESQHLAGIEMGMCGLPVVAPPIGIYYGGGMGLQPAGTKASDYSRGIEYLLEHQVYSPEHCRVHWLGIASRDACRDAWRGAVEWTLSN